MSDQDSRDNEFYASMRQAEQDRRKRFEPHPMSPAFNAAKYEDCVPVIEDMVQGMISMNSEAKP